MSFAERVVELRLALGIANTTEFAKQLKMSQPSVRAIENGETSVLEMKTATFMKLVAFLKTNPYYLFNGRGPMGPMLSPDDEEAEVASLWRQLHDPYRGAWLASGYALKKWQPESAPSTDDPFTEPKKDRKP